MEKVSLETPLRMVRALQQVVKGSNKKRAYLIFPACGKDAFFDLA